MDRQQMVLFSPKLDAVIGPDHPVRLLDEVLSALDWSPWERRYCLELGQPPFHPKVVASALLYGLSLGLRSSRQLERACLTSLDFIWLVERRDIDHCTFCDFRNRFGAELKDLFGQVGRVAMTMGLVRLNQVSLDGTKVAANSSPHATATAKTLEGRLAELDRQVEQMLAEAQAADERDGRLFGEATPNRLPRALADVQKRQKLLQQALAAARAKDAAAGVSEKPEANGAGGAEKTVPSPADEGEKPKPKKPAAVPVADPDSSIQANKHGGFAPNYTPMVTVDGERGFVVDADVLADSDETQAVLPAVERIEETYGQKPEQVLADGAFGSGPNLSGLAAAGVEAYIPLEQREDRTDNPARRPAGRVPVAEADWGKLPVNGRTKKLGRLAFVYEKEEDRYWCPLGKALDFTRVKRKSRRHGVVEVREYRCAGCAGCPLRQKCVEGESLGRVLERDAHEPWREAMDERMRTEAGKAKYGRRKWMGEYAQGVLKSVMGLRQFLSRGLEKVRTEWLWACTGFNVRKLAQAVAQARAAVAANPV
jgi:transposase